MTAQKKQNFLQGALILSIATIVVKIIGALFKIPLSLMDRTAYGYFTAAYNIYVPIYTIAVSGLPVAVSRVISASMTMGRYRDVKVLYRTALKIFMLTGSLGSVAMLVASFIYPDIIGIPNVRPAMLVMIPAILFCCIVSAHRGLYEGCRNMTPTAVSQILESIGKLAIGLSLAYGAMYFGQWQFSRGEKVFGQVANSSAEALTLSLPYVAAGAMLGVTAGSFLALLYMVYKHRKDGFGFSKQELVSSPAAITNKRALRSLLAIAVPVAIGSVASQLTNLIDSFSLQYCLKQLLESHPEAIKSQYAVQIAESGTKDILAWLNGIFGTAMTFTALVPTVTTTFGISALPAVTAAWTSGDKKQLRTTMNSAIRLTLLLALPSSVGLCVLATPIMGLFYPSVEAVVIGPLLAVLGASVVFMCILYPVNAMMQAVGRADLPVKVIIIGGVIKLLLNIVLISQPSLNIMGSAISTGICYLVMATLSLFLLRKAAKINLAYISLFIKPLFASICCGAAAWAADGLLGQLIAPKFATVIAIAVAGVVYVIMLLLTKALKKSDILMLPKGQKIAQILAKHDWIE